MGRFRHVFQCFWNEEKDERKEKVTFDQDSQTLTHATLVAYADHVIGNPIKLSFFASTLTQ